MQVMDTTGVITAKNYIKNLRTELTDFYDKVSKVYTTNSVIEELMYKRGYTSEKMYNTLKEVGVLKISGLSDIWGICDVNQYSTYKDWKLTKDGSTQLLLANRYIIPIRDIAGKVSALVGWSESDPKYLLTNTLGFVKDAQFFNAECYRDYIMRGETTVYLVEGFFDALSLRSEGFCALSNFGLLLSAIKVEMLQRYNKVVVISDADAAGRRPLPYIDGTKKEKQNQWHIKNPVTYVQIQIDGIKDADDLIKTFDCVDEIYELRNKGAIAYIREN